MRIFSKWLDVIDFVLDAIGFVARYLGPFILAMLCGGLIYVLLPAAGVRPTERELPPSTAGVELWAANLGIEIRGLDCGPYTLKTDLCTARVRVPGELWDDILRVECEWSSDAKEWRCRKDE